MTGNFQKSKFFRVARRWVRDESGATAIEYGLMASLIAIAIIGGASSLATAINDNFQEAATALEDAMPD